MAAWAGRATELVVDSSAGSYRKDLLDAMTASRATICFDATGGGTLGYEVVSAMETAAVRNPGVGRAPDGYGSSTFKKLYVYGGEYSHCTLYTA
jgi:NADPH2:quinone reductase